MTTQEVLSHVDHTQLSPTATVRDIALLCEEALAYRTASVCIHPRFVRYARGLLAGEIPVCTVVGFPLGANTSAMKAAEAREAVENGASEIDMVLSLGELKAGNHQAVKNEIALVKEAVGERILKVIVETCLLSDEEKAAACRLVAQAGADYIKTSTGFSTGGATAHDVELFARCLLGTGVKIKAAGGIRTFGDMEEFLGLGADRLGSSSAIKIVAALGKKA